MNSNVTLTDVDRVAATGLNTHLMASPFRYDFRETLSQLSGKEPAGADVSLSFRRSLAQHFALPLARIG
jgi:hypothetical protein